MRKNSTPFITLLLFSLAALVLVHGRSAAQDPNFCGSEAEEIPWVVPPAIAAISGDPVTFDPARVYIGDRHGSLRLWDLEFDGTLSQNTTFEPGNGLPDNVAGIWDIDILADGTRIALVTYRESGNEWYGVLRSTDGDTWDLITPTSLKTAHFASIEGKGRQINTRRGSRRLDYTGNYWRVPLYELEWLSDGLTGWMWGRNGVLGTTDGGLTWSILYEADVSVQRSIGQNVQIWGMAMKDANVGAAVMGGLTAPFFYYTTDGAKTWTQVTTFPLGTSRLADLSVIKNEFRAVLFNDAAQDQPNTRLVYSSDASTWELRRDEQNWVKSESVFATNVIWTSSMDGFLIQRQGEIWRTMDGGNVWIQSQEIDQQYDAVLYGDSTSIAGTGTFPFFPYAGYGQRTIAVRTALEDPYLVNVITDTCTGDIRPYIAVWPVGEFSSVPTRTNASSLDLSLQPNPATDRCMVRFTLPEPSIVLLSVVDVGGATVQLVDMGHHEAGHRQFEVSLSDLPAGAYRVVVSGGSLESSASVVVGAR